MTRPAARLRITAETRSRAPRTVAHVLQRSDARATAQAAGLGFRIMDRRTGYVYIPLDYPTQRDAVLALADLLAPYPAGDPWRARLHVEVATGPLKVRPGFGMRRWTPDQLSEHGRHARAVQREREQAPESGVHVTVAARARVA